MGFLSDIERFRLNTFVDQGYISRSEKGNLQLYNYTDKTAYDGFWNELTRQCRGFIIEKLTGKVIAKPFEKFFNLGEREETLFCNLPVLPYTIQEKVDGSLGIVYHYEGEWHIATRGSFYSDQAVKGSKLLKLYNFKNVPTNYTLLTEIVYPENRIVVDYGRTEELVLLAIFDRDSGMEVPLFAPSLGENSIIQMRVAERHNLTVEQAMELSKTLPKDEEGFVIRFDNGFRVKIKGNEYMRIHKLIMHMTPLAFWESMQGGVVNKTYVMQLPEEFRPEYEKIIDTLECQYSTVLKEVVADAEKLPTKELTPDGRKRIGLYCKSVNDLKHPYAMFPFLLNNGLDKYIMKKIRPDANQYKELA